MQMVSLHSWNLLFEQGVVDGGNKSWLPFFARFETVKSKAKSRVLLQLQMCVVWLLVFSLHFRLGRPAHYIPHNGSETTGIEQVSKKQDKPQGLVQMVHGFTLNFFFFFTLIIGFVH